MFYSLLPITSTNPRAQDELEHRCIKHRFACSGKKKGTWNVSLAHQEAIERFVAKVNSARDSLLAAEEASQPKCPPRLCTSPTDHFHIAASTWQSHDLTEWLSNHRDDPATHVRSHRRHPID